MTHVLITGASSGIGASLARAWSAKGAHLTLVARRAHRLEVLAEGLGTPCRIIAADLCDSLDWFDALPPVDVLVNNAAQQIIGPIVSIDPDLAARNVLLNLTRPLQLVAKALPQMQRRGNGAIVNITSLVALAPAPGMAWYNATKGGLAAASEALRAEVGPSVKVLTVYPGIIADTDMAQEALSRYKPSIMLRLQPRATSSQLANAILAALDRDRARLVYPRANALARWFPASTRALMDRFTFALVP